MKQDIIPIITFFFVITFLLFDYAHANEQPPSPSFIDSFEEDITGDGLREYFKLQGRLLSDNSSYYQDIWLDITSPFSKQWNISFKGGYHPEISLIDINHDQIVDIFYEVALGEHDGPYHSQVYTLKDGNVAQINLPKNNHIKGKYIDDFQIELILHPNEQPIKIPITNQKQFIDQNVYKENGEVLEEKNVIIDPIKRYEPTLISKSKGYGVKSSRQIKDFLHEEVIGTVETLWYYDHNDWIILKTNWRPS